MQYADLLAVENWFEDNWFASNRVRLAGTSAVYRVPTKAIGGRFLELVVKNCRVGENVLADTDTLVGFLNAEFNSPWEEFSLTTELREGKFGDSSIAIHTQHPLAIFVPSEKMQPWQSGRSVDRLRRIKARHPGIDIDILKQYKLVYGWIRGKDLVECLRLLNIPDEASQQYCVRCTEKSIAALEAKGFAVADMKPSHIIIGENDVRAIEAFHSSSGDGAAFLESLVDKGQYSIIDYELLLRTPEHDKAVFDARRRVYLKLQRDRFEKTALPSHLKSEEIMGVPYVCGHTESTGGLLWVVGRNGELFDYFLPERWRRTHSWRLSEDSEIFYTVSKDHIHLVWKISRVGERPQSRPEHPHARAIAVHGYNSPFEEFYIANELTQKGVGTIYVRAIYRTGSTKLVPSTDSSRYISHTGIVCPDGTPILQNSYNYISLRGYFNGLDAWVAANDGALCRPLDLDKALTLEYVTPSLAEGLMGDVLDGVYHAGYDGKFLSMDDLLLAITPEKTLLKTQDGAIDVRICNLELIARRM